MLCWVPFTPRLDNPDQARRAGRNAIYWAPAVGQKLLSSLQVLNHLVPVTALPGSDYFLLRRWRTGDSEAGYWAKGKKLPSRETDFSLRKSEAKARCLRPHILEHSAQKKITVSAPGMTKVWALSKQPSHIHLQRMRAAESQSKCLNQRITRFCAPKQMLFLFNFFVSL